MEDSLVRNTYNLTFTTLKNTEATIILSEKLSECEYLNYKLGKISASLLHNQIYKAFDDRQQLECEVERLKMSLADKDAEGDYNYIIMLF